MTFREQLIRLRRQYGLTQEQLGEIAGVSRQTVSKWENGDTTPELEKLYLLCDHFRISMDELTGRSAAAVPPQPEPPRERDPWRWHYEYKSERTFLGLPLVHINIGRGFPPYRAKGVLAIGNIATGFLALGGVAVGLVALGGVGLGLLALGGLTLGLLLGIGGIALGGVALGGIALGYFACGGIALGVYALGGIATASRMAAGGIADAPVALCPGSPWWEMTRDAFEQAVRALYPRTPRWLIHLFYRVTL